MHEFLISSLNLNPGLFWTQILYSHRENTNFTLLTFPKISVAWPIYFCVESESHVSIADTSLFFTLKIAFERPKMPKIRLYKTEYYR